MKKVLTQIMVLGICSVALAQLPSVKPMPKAASVLAVTVDGDLSEWTGSSTWLVLGNSSPEGGFSLGAATDMSNAKYAVRWDDGGFYFAATMTDTVQVFAPSNVAWNNPDRIEAYADFTNSDFGGYAYAGTTGPFSDAQETVVGQADGLGGLWLSNGWPGPGPLHGPPIAACQIVGSTYNYELYVPAINPLTNPIVLALGMTVGADLAAVSWDGATYSFVQANSVPGKWNNAAAMQNWILVPEPLTLVLLGAAGLALRRRKR